MVTVREASRGDEPFLVQCLALAADWRPGAAVRPAAEVLASPDLAHYLPHWGGKRDRAVVAEQPGEGPVGGAWWRLFPPDDPGYGFVAADVPELSVAVLPRHRGAGIGTGLLQALVALARQDGLAGLSLSVEPDNPALRLYRRLGFAQAGASGGALTLLLPLGGASGPA